MRMKRFAVAGLLAAATVLAPMVAAAAELLTNGGFEAGFSEDPLLDDGWTESPVDALARGLVNTTGLSHLFLQPGQAVHLGPHSFALNSNGQPVETAGGAPYAIQYDPTDGYQFAALLAPSQFYPVTISQSFTVGRGANFTGSAAFIGRDSDQFNDSAFVTLYGPQGFQRTLFSASLSQLGPFGYTPWTRLSASLTTPGVYRLVASVTNGGDEFNSSRLLLDGFGVSTVPEPASWALIIGGFFGAGIVLRRRRRHTA